MDQTQKPFLTVGDICRETGEKTHRVKYAIDTYRIDPIGRAGILRVFSPDQLPQIRSALARIAGRREAANA